MAVVSEAQAKNFITNEPIRYIDSFTTFIPKGYVRSKWETFDDDQKAAYILWYFNKDEETGTREYFESGNPTIKKVYDLLPEGTVKDIFLERFPDQTVKPDEHNNTHKITAYNVWNKMNELMNKGGSSRRTRRNRHRKYNKIYKSRRLVKNRRTRRRMSRRKH